jgi:hypothetical protein
VSPVYTVVPEPEPVMVTLYVAVAEAVATIAKARRIINNFFILSSINQ